MEGNPSIGGSHARGVDKYNDFGQTEGYFGNGAGYEVSYM